MSEGSGVTPADAFKELEIKCLRGNFVKATNKNDLLGHAIKNAPGRGHLAPHCPPQPLSLQAAMPGGPTGLGLSQLWPHHPATGQARGLNGGCNEQPGESLEPTFLIHTFIWESLEK